MKMTVGQILEAKTQREQEADSLFKAWNYYMVKGKDNTIATVAIGKMPNGACVRGIAICSVREQFNRNEGAFRAIGRMNKAAVSKGASHEIRVIPYEFNFEKNGKPTSNKMLSYFSVDRFFKSFGKVLFKAEYDVKPTKRERGILERVAKYGRVYKTMVIGDKV